MVPKLWLMRENRVPEARRMTSSVGGTHLTGLFAPNESRVKRLIAVEFMTHGPTEIHAGEYGL